MSITLTGKTIGQLTTLTGITEDTLFPVELSGTTYKIPYTKVKQFTHYLGEQYLGGVIFNLYIGLDGLEHGQVVSLTQANKQWSSVTNTVTGANSTWDGQYNTNLIPNSQAKTWLESLGVGWYLPAIDELRILLDNRFFVNKSLSNIVGATTIPVLGSYWSSTEYDFLEAQFIHLGYSYTSSIGKGNINSVRGVKSF
jgi:hypothetical protein